MAKRMLIDATHREETRVVVVNGDRLEEFDFETSTKQQLKGNIYLARVTRVEPSLQAAFVEYGGNRHGFLAFGEIHPDYYRIPVSDRQSHGADRGDFEAGREPDSDLPESHVAHPAPSGPEAAPSDSTPDAITGPSSPESSGPVPLFETPGPDFPAARSEPERNFDYFDRVHETPAEPTMESSAAAPDDAGPQSADALAEPPQGEGLPFEASGIPDAPLADADHPPAAATVESLGGDDIDDEEPRRQSRPMRHYKIQEVIKRRQVLLVQVNKEERGNKGAALTTYLSLAGRYCVLMPNTDRGGGISRRITSPQDRKRLKGIMDELQVPDGMAVILRTAGMERDVAEIKRDYEYLMRLWDDIRELTLRSNAPALVYQEGNLIKRAMRDLYSPDLDEVLVEGDDAFRAARDLMNMLTPSHVGRIKRYDDPSVPLFQRFHVNAELDEIHQPTVRLRSGGYVVINPTEALVAIDVNSGRATRERHIEETAFKTNLEAAEEIARQLRLRDLAGLIVIDFIDMEDTRHQHAVERRLKEAMKSDRARIQIGRISPFGLLELSRQRLRPSLVEVSSERCPHCGGSGFVRSIESSALHVLRGIEEECMKSRGGDFTVRVPDAIALYLLNQKRANLASIEQRYAAHLGFERDDALIMPDFKIERVRTRAITDTAPAPIRGHAPEPDETTGADIPFEPRMPAAEPMSVPDLPQAAAEEAAGDDRGRRRRRRRRRFGRDEDRGPAPRVNGEGEIRHEAPMPPAAEATNAPPTEISEMPQPLVPEEAAPPHGPDGDGDRPRRRRRGRRGGRRRHGDDRRSDRPHDEAQPQPAMPHPAEERAAGPFDAPPPAQEHAAAHDWPWNRPAAPAQPDEAPQPLFVPRTDNAIEVAPPPAPPPPPPPVAVAFEAAPPPPPPPPPAEPSAEPVPEAPPGPPRRGWWKRLTSGG